MNNSYTIYRFYQDGRPNRVMAKGLTLKQAQEWCNDPETSSKTATKGKRGCHCEWFDGYSQY